MFISSDQYFIKVKSLVASSQRLSVAIAFWGQGSDELFKDWQGESVRIICNLGMGGTNPDPIKYLLEMKNIEVRYLDDLHAKVLVGEKSVLVGSANFSTNGLNWECDENAGWREAGLFVQKNEDVIKEAQEWFESIWVEAEPVTQPLLESVKAIWLERQNNRPYKILLDCKAAELKDRKINFLIWREYPSVEAFTAFERKKQELENLSGGIPLLKIDFVANWPELDSAALYVWVYYGPRRGVRVTANFWKRTPALDGEYQNEDGEMGSIQLLTLDKSFRMAFDVQELHNLLTPWLNVTILDDFEATSIPLYNFFSWREENPIA